MSKRAARVHETPGYVLHTTAWKETSLIVQAFSRDHGWVSMVAKGAKRPHSVLRSALSLFQPLLLSWTGSSEIKTLTRAECAGVHALPGPAMMSSWYMNELLFRLLPREDPHPRLFDAYVMALQSLATGSSAAGALRKFEWMLLQETGYGLDAEQPDFDDAKQEPALRAALRARLAEHLAGKPLATRQVLLALQRYQGPKPSSPS
jgi:DNA repair protein RecO (recombination protein O)